MGPAPVDDFWGQFNPEDASASSPMQGGGGYNGGPMGQLMAPMGPAQPGQLQPMPGGQPVATGPMVGGQPQQSSGPVSMSDFSRAWEQSSYPGTVDGLKQFLASNPAYAASGITLGGSKGDKVYGPGGAYWGDAVIAAGEGGKGKSALNGDTGGGGGGSMGAFLTPYGENFTMPTAEEFMAMPGVQAQTDAIRKGRERGAAAKGTLLTTGTEQGIAHDTADYLGNQYLNFSNAKMGAQNFNRDTFYHNQDAPFSKLFSTSQLGMNAASEPTVGATQPATASAYTPPAAAPAAAPMAAIVPPAPKPVGKAPRQIAKIGTGSGGGGSLRF